MNTIKTEIAINILWKIDFLGIYVAMVEANCTEIDGHYLMTDLQNELGNAVCNVLIKNYNNN
jgi:hypothetical protein